MAFTPHRPQHLRPNPTFADPRFRAALEEGLRNLARGWDMTYGRRGIKWPGLLGLIDMAVPESRAREVGELGLLGGDGDMIVARHRLIDPLVTIGSREPFFDRMFPMPGAAGDGAARMGPGSGAAAGELEALGPYSPALPTPSAGEHSIG